MRFAMPDASLRFKVVQRFTALRVDASVPPDQSVLMVIKCEPESVIEEGEIVVAIVVPVREPSAVATFTRIGTQGQYLYRTDAETFWASVIEVAPSDD